LSGRLFREVFWRENEQNEQRREQGKWVNSVTMQKERYSYKADDSGVKFEFQSHGPNGIIEKAVSYSELGKLENGTLVFNLGFGDRDGMDRLFNDLSISNNADREKILATVANTAMDIMDHYDGIAIYAEGSTPARTRLYQMGINANKEEIESMFDIYGDLNNKWQKVESGKNYRAFLLTRKNYKFN
jgi:hypothetical protein